MTHIAQPTYTLPSEIMTRLTSLPFFISALDHVRKNGSIPPESVKDHRVVTVNGIRVIGRQTQVPHLHLIAGDPMVHHREAGVEGSPP